MDILEQRIIAVLKRCDSCMLGPFVDACWMSSPPCTVGVLRKATEEPKLKAKTNHDELMVPVKCPRCEGEGTIQAPGGWQECGTVVCSLCGGKKQIPKVVAAYEENKVLTFELVELAAQFYLQQDNGQPQYQVLRAYHNAFKDPRKMLEFIEATISNRKG